MILQIPRICIVSGFLIFSILFQLFNIPYYIISTSVSVIISLNHKIADLKIQIFITPVNFCKCINIRQIVTLQMRNERFYVGKGISEESTTKVFFISNVSSLFERFHYFQKAVLPIKISAEY